MMAAPQPPPAYIERCPAPAERSCITAAPPAASVFQAPALPEPPLEAVFKEPDGFCAGARWAFRWSNPGDASFNAGTLIIPAHGGAIICPANGPAEVRGMRR